MGSFVHLSLHTEYSLKDSVIRLDELMPAVAKAGMPAVAMTDWDNLFALVKFYRQAMQVGVKPIIGADIRMRDGQEREPFRLRLLCMSHTGFQQLSRLISKSYVEGQGTGQPLMERGWLTPDNTSDLIALSGASWGDVGRHLGNGRNAEAHRAARAWRELFGDRYYLEVQRLGRADDEALVQATLRLSEEWQVAAVATQEVRFLRSEDFDAHEARVCIHDGEQLSDPKRVRRYTSEQYLKTPEQMHALFSDCPTLLEQTIEIAKRCNVELALGQAVLPAFGVPAGVSEGDYLCEQAARGLEHRRLRAAEAALAGRLPIRQVSDAEYPPRLKHELDVITSMGFAGYFLIVADFIRWARENDIPVGPGRGSGAGSLVAYALGITDLDPLEHDLLFERFLNPERVSMPDFDIDFCTEGRDRVIEYVAKRYGRERVAQIITYGTMAAKAVVRDVGRVLGMSYPNVDQIAKLIPNELDITLQKALEQEPELSRRVTADPEVRELMTLALKLEGLPRNAGMHAGGVVIAPAAMTDFTPLFCEGEGGSVVTQFDKDDVEKSGLVKFDFLGLRTLTVIRLALSMINDQREQEQLPPVDLDLIPLTDAKTFELLCSGKTTGVFQLESRGMRDLVRKLIPDCFEDIVALMALFRPGPLEAGMVKDFIERKHAKSGEPIDMLHPTLEPVLASTYGVILYQEQVMQIAQVLSGYTLGGADILRRAMGKKNAEEMATQRDIFVNGATARAIQADKAKFIFDLIEKFAGYGFNKSHSAAYAMLTYHTAWLKAHYPEAFVAAVLSCDLDKTDKVTVGIDDAKAIGLTILSPDVNSSEYRFTIAGQKTLRYGLGAIKGVGQGAVEAVLEARQAGRFKTLTDFVARVDQSRVNRRTMEALLYAGAFDGLGVHRAALEAQLPQAIQAGEQAQRAQDTGQNDLFGGPVPSAVVPVAAASSDVLEWSLSVRLKHEKEVLGNYISGHPMDEFVVDRPFLAPLTIASFADERPTAEPNDAYSRGRTVTLAGVAKELIRRKKDNRTVITLDDGTGRLEVWLSTELSEHVRDWLSKDQLLLVEGQLRFDGYADAWRVNAKSLMSLDDARAMQVKGVLLCWPTQHQERLTVALAECLQRARGGKVAVWVYRQTPEAHGLLELGDAHQIRVSRELLQSLCEILPPSSVRWFYRAADIKHLVEPWRVESAVNQGTMSH
jgi:DNA polymerase III subunit alpha